MCCVYHTQKSFACIAVLGRGMIFCQHSGHKRSVIHIGILERFFYDCTIHLSQVVPIGKRIFLLLQYTIFELLDVHKNAYLYSTLLQICTYYVLLSLNNGSLMD